MLIDLISLAVITWMIIRATKPGNQIGSFMVSLILYTMIKLPVLGFVWGWTYPLSKDPNAHTISGLCSLIFWVLIFRYRPIVKFRQWLASRRNARTIRNGGHVMEIIS